MKTLILKNHFMKPVVLLMMIFSLIVSTASAQDDMNASQVEEVQKQNMEYLDQIHEIIKDYPAFAYTYDMKNGEVQDVTVTGVKRTIDKKRLEVLLFDLKSNKNMIRNKANQIGVFYSVDEAPEYKDGRDKLQEDLLGNLTYPEDVKDWGLEGTVFVKFVVDENGEIPFATTATNIEPTVDVYLEELRQQAVEAIKATSGNWEPGKIDGEEVSSLAVVPVTFDFRKNPTLPALIR